MQIKTASGIDLDTVVLVDPTGSPYTASGGGGSGGNVVATGNVATGIADSGNPVKIGGIGKTSLPTAVPDGARNDIWLSSRGALMICGYSQSGGDGYPNASIVYTQGQASVANLNAFAGHNFNGVSWDRQRGDVNGTYVVNKPVTSGGTATYKVVSAASTNTAFIKASGGQIYGMQFSNSSASWRFVKLYNKATAPTLASDVPVDIVGIPPGGRVEMNRTLGMSFTTGIAIAVVGGYADTDVSATLAGEVVGSIQYF